MKKSKLSDMYRGWFIGDFDPSVLKTKDFEVGVLLHTKGEHWPAHYHIVATEYNVLLSGSMEISGEMIGPGDIFVMEPSEIASPIFHEDCQVLCVKIPSVKGDKYIV
jgi:hypothetical protein